MDIDKILESAYPYFEWIGLEDSEFRLFALLAVCLLAVSILFFAREKVGYKMVVFLCLLIGIGAIGYVAQTATSSENDTYFDDERKLPATQSKRPITDTTLSDGTGSPIFTQDPFDALADVLYVMPSGTEAHVTLPGREGRAVHRPRLYDDEAMRSGYGWTKLGLYYYVADSWVTANFDVLRDHASVKLSEAGIDFPRGLLGIPLVDHTTSLNRFAVPETGAQIVSVFPVGAFPFRTFRIILEKGDAENFLSVWAEISESGVVSASNFREGYFARKVFPNGAVAGNTFDQPGGGGELDGIVDTADIFYVVEENGDWARILTTSGTGDISSSWIEKPGIMRVSR